MKSVSIGSRARIPSETMTKAERQHLATHGFSGGTDTRPSAVMRRLERRGLMTIEDRGPAALKRYVWRLTGAGVDARASAREICDDCGRQAADHTIQPWGTECP